MEFGTGKSYEEIFKYRLVHPWAREGSKASKALGPNKWLVHHGGYLPTIEEIEDYCDAVMADDSSYPVSEADVSSFLNSSMMAWIRYAHHADVDKNSRGYESISENWVDGFSPADLIVLLRDAPLLSGFLFTGTEPQNFKVGNVTRVGMALYDRMVADDEKPYDIDKLMVLEPTKLLSSLLSTNNEDGLYESVVIALSTAGVSFETYAGAMRQFEGMYELANEAIIYNVADRSYNEEKEDYSNVPAEAFDADGLASIFIESYLAERGINVVYDDLDIKTILAFAKTGVYESKIIRKCVEQGIDPELAARI